MKFKCSVDGFLLCHHAESQMPEAKLGPVYAPHAGRIRFTESANGALANKYVALAFIDFYKSETRILSPIQGYVRCLVPNNSWVEAGTAIFEMHF